MPGIPSVCFFLGRLYVVMKLSCSAWGRMQIKTSLQAFTSFSRCLRGELHLTRNGLTSNCRKCVHLPVYALYSRWVLYHGANVDKLVETTSRASQRRLP